MRPVKNYSELLNAYKWVYKDPSEDLNQWHTALHRLQITEEYAGQVLKIMPNIISRLNIGLPPPQHPDYEDLVSKLAKDLTEWMISDRPDVYCGLLKIIADAGL
jgi:hypothetical protein